MFLLCLCWIREYVDFISSISLETDVLDVLVLDQVVRGFYFLHLIGDRCSCCACAGSESAWILFLAFHWRLTFLMCLCCIRSCVDFISCISLETDVLDVLVLDQIVCGFYFLHLIGD